LDNLVANGNKDPKYAVWWCMMKERTLVTGFGAFGTVSENPSAYLARESSRTFNLLEVSFDAVDEYLAALDVTPYEQIVLMGVAANRDHMSLEMFARNWIGSTPDVRGKAIEGSIHADQPLLLDTTLWSAEIASKLVFEDRLLRISLDAGSYLCNYIYYRALEMFPGKRIGFLHVASQSKIALELQMISLQKILQTIES